MTGAVRKQIRAAARTALQGVSGYTEISAWQQTVDVSALPAWAVATPNSRHNRISSVDNAEHTPQLLVLVKRTGTPESIEDSLDDDADALAPLIVAAIKSQTRDCELIESAMRIDRSGAEPVGTLTLQFQISDFD